jgi:hypothetical protein
MPAGVTLQADLGRRFTVCMQLRIPEFEHHPDTAVVGAVCCTHPVEESRSHFALKLCST